MPQEMRFAEVAVDAPAGIERTFSYSIPDSLSVGPGHLVTVPFGKRTLTGVVFSLASQPQVEQTRDIKALLFEEPILDEQHLNLARWMSQYYVCSLFEAAALMLPPGGRVRTRTYLAISPDAEDVEEASLTPFQERAFTYIQKHGPVDQNRLIKAFGENVRHSITRLVDNGLVTSSVSSAKPTIGYKFVEFARMNLEAKSLAKEWLEDSSKKAHRQATFLEHILGCDDPIELSKARKDFGSSAVNGLLDKGWIEKEFIAVERDPLQDRVFPPTLPVSLTKRQEAVTSEIRAALDGSSDDTPFLVQGVTGSGKTEVYLDAVEHCLNLGKKAIVLVPEIALTHQTIERFASKFPGRVAILHSRLSPGERFDQWWKVRHGDYDVVIGSRSAIFSPLPNLGLVVIDEEHEWTYKQQDSSPRYHARDVAIQLAKITRALVLMGSASPDISSYYKGLRRDYRLLLIPERFDSRENGNSSGEGGAPLATVEVVDMRSELREGNRDMFSRKLLSAMDECLREGNQMMLFLNRRGSASYLQCRMCGYNLRCSRCDISMTYHRQSERFLCHYCGYRRTAPDKCPQCLSYRMSYYGIGTQAVAEEAQRLFPQATVMRWDSDVTSGPKTYQDMLSQFRSGQAQILVGTQMIAKGLHFPSVTLVGIVSADVGLNIPDYRAGERAFQLLCQVSGRAGRGHQEGRVILQTFQPENYAIQTAALQDYQTFYTKEMAFRREQSNPPYSKLIHLLYAHTNRAECEADARKLAEALSQQKDEWGLSDVEILGPNPAYPTRLRGKYRWHIVLRGAEPRALLDKVSIPQGWSVDIDPVTLT